MGRGLLALILVLGAAIGAARAQSCDEELPASLSNYSGLACSAVWNNYILRYSKDQDNVLSIVLSTAYATGWVGMGFSKDGMMVGSSAMVGWMGKTGIPHIKPYYLGGKSSSEVKLNQGQLLTTAVRPTVVVEQAKIYIAFQLKFSAPVTQQNLLFAFGMKIPVNKHLTKHDDKTSLSFDFSSGTSSASSSYPSNLKRAHGALAVFGWGVLLPIGAIIARYCKHREPLWYYLHVVIQFIGFIFGLAAVVAGIALYDKLHANVTAHRGLGIFVLVLGILQVCKMIFSLFKNIPEYVLMFLFYFYGIEVMVSNPLSHVGTLLPYMHQIMVNVLCQLPRNEIFQINNTLAPPSTQVHNVIYVGKLNAKKQFDLVKRKSSMVIQGCCL